VEYRASNGQVLDKFDTGEVGGREWKVIERALRPPAGTAKLRVRLVARRRKGRANNSYYDDLRLIAVRPERE
jgi:hypothetical protein